LPLVAALPAAPRASSLQRTACRAVPGGPSLAELEQSLDLPQPRAALLQPRGLLVEHVEPVVVTRGHLVGHAAQVPLELGELPGQVLPLLEQLRLSDRSRARRSSIPATGHGLALAALPLRPR